MAEATTILAAPCGAYCGGCKHFNQCHGCVQAKGKPFWTTMFRLNICPLYDCAVNQKHLEHCGLCDRFPCQIFTSMRDPSLSKEEADKVIKTKQDNLIQRKKIGTEAWVKTQK